MIKFMSLSSGSCGNCYYLGTENGGIVIDAGVSLRRLKRVLQEYDLTFDSFSAILVTHDHLDHIRHLGSFCKRLGMPTFGETHSIKPCKPFQARKVSPYHCHRKELKPTNFFCKIIRLEIKKNGLKVFLSDRFDLEISLSSLSVPGFLRRHRPHPKHQPCDRSRKGTTERPHHRYPLLERPCSAIQPS